MNLPIFRDSSSDNAIRYDDWHSEVDNFVREGHSSNLIRDSILSTLEGHPRHTAKAAMEDGDGSLRSIMSALDQVYGGATTYTTLLNKLNSVQQGYDESAKDYYERVLQIWIKLQEFHAYMFRKGDLEHQTKEAFFNGLKSEYQAMVVHKRDDPTISITDLLSAVRECEENQENNRRNRRADYAKAYPPSHSCPAYRDDQNARAVPPQAPPPPQSTNRYRSDNRRVDRNVPVHAAQVELGYDYHYQDDGDYIPEYANYDLPLDQEDEELTFATEMCHIAIQKADVMERQSGKCFNYKELGHYWRDCPKPLREEFQRLQDHPKRRQEELNGKGGPRKGWPSPPECQHETTGPGQGCCRPGAPVDQSTTHPPYWNDDPHARWLGPSNVGYALIDGCRETVLIDSGARANAITPEYCVKHELKVRPVYELATSPTSIPVSGIGGITSALGYTIINIQIPGIPSYNEEQVTLVIQDVSGLGMRVPVILGMPTIYRLCRQMKETKINSAPKE